MKDLGQCCDGHLLCKACIEKAAKLILVGNKSVSIVEEFSPFVKLTFGLC